MSPCTLGFAGLGPRQVGVRGGSAGRAGQPGLGLALQGWVLRRWQSGQGRWGWQAGWLGWAGGAGRARQQAGAWLGFSGLSPRQVGAASAWLGFAGLGPRQVGQVGHVGRLAGFVGASGQVGLAGRLAWLGRLASLAGSAGAAGAWLGFAGLGPRQVAGRAAGAWLGFAGLGPRQVAVRGEPAGRAGQPGLGLALLGWVLGRWQSGVGRQAGQGRGLGFAGLGPRQAAAGQGRWGRQWQPGLGLALLGWVLGRWQSGVGRQAGQGRGLGFAGLGPRQVQPGLSLALLGWVLGRWQQGQPGLGLALLGWVLGRWQSGQGRWGWEAGRLGWADGAGRARRQAGGLGWAAGAAGAWLGFAGLGPRQAGRVGQVGLAWLCWAGWGMQGEPGLVRMGRLGRWSRLVGKGRADQLVLQNELEFDQIALLVTSSYYKDIEGDEGTALGSWRKTSGAFARKGRLRFRYIGATVTRIEILISAIDRGGIRLGVIGLAVAAAQVKQTLDPSTKTLANVGLLRAKVMMRIYSIDWVGVDGIKWFDDEPDGPGSADSAKDGLKRLLSLEDSGGSIAIKGDRGGRYIRKSYHRQYLEDGLERDKRQGWKDWPRGFSDGAGSYPWLEAGPRLRTGGAETPPAFRFGKGGQEKGGAGSAPGVLQGGFCWILQDFEEEGVAEQKLGGGAHQGQSGWSETTGATDFFKEAPDLESTLVPHRPRHLSFHQSIILRVLLPDAEAINKNKAN
ncbi:hypothetical protein BY996DRAFT_6533732 [Phakopsora pachyrhizi]|nr:hypothetical protein BY996DRAFT_6533732 [Phakopsora pachyrhizi]